MFPDHHPPPFDRLLKVVTSIDNWLKADVANVAVVHCKVRSNIVLISHRLKTFRPNFLFLF